MKKIVKTKKLGFYAGEKLKSLTDNQLANLKQQCCELACEEMFVIAIQAVKDVFRDNVSNEQMEQFIIRLQQLLCYIGDGTVSLSTLHNCIDAENGIKYDPDAREWLNVTKCTNID